MDVCVSADDAGMSELSVYFTCLLLVTVLAIRSYYRQGQRLTKRKDNFLQSLSVDFVTKSRF